MLASHALQCWATTSHYWATTFQSNLASPVLGVFDDLMHMLSSDCTVDMIYLDFSKAFDQGDHDILSHKLKDLGITGKLGIWLFQFLPNRSHYVRLPSGLSQNSPVLSMFPKAKLF